MLSMKQSRIGVRPSTVGEKDSVPVVITYITEYLIIAELRDIQPTGPASSERHQPVSIRTVVNLTGTRYR